VKRALTLVTVALGATALALATTAAGDRGHGGDKRKHHASRAAVTVFDLRLQPRQEVPRVGLRAEGRGHLTLDVTRDSAGAITSGEAVFYVNYDFPSTVNFTGLHVHQAAKGANGPIVVDSGIAAFSDTDGDGNVVALVTGVSPTLLQAILDRPRDYYVNLHTSVNPTGAMRDQLHKGKGQRNRHDD
jgi:hypothetical protein